MNHELIPGQQGKGATSNGAEKRVLDFFFRKFETILKEKNLQLQCRFKRRSLDK